MGTVCSHERVRRMQLRSQELRHKKPRDRLATTAVSSSCCSTERGTSHLEPLEELPTTKQRHNHSKGVAACTVCAPRAVSAVHWDRYLPPTIVHEYAALSTQNSRFRKYMEDECVAIPNFHAFPNDPARSCFFGVYDGHGGDFCAKYAADNFHNELARAMADKFHDKRVSEIERRLSGSPTSTDSTEMSEAENDVLSEQDIEDCYSTAFTRIDQELGEYDESSTCGSTAVTCLIRKSRSRTTFHVANVGDSRAIFYGDGKTSRLSVDHKATNEDEVKRIKALNGIIFNKRVGGVVAVTRALGQADEKPYICSSPHVESVDVDCKDDAFLVLASDGVSDVFSDEEVTQFVRQHLARGETSLLVCKRLLEEAKALGSTDNMTVVLIRFGQQQP